MCYVFVVEIAAYIKFGKSLFLKEFISEIIINYNLARINFLNV